MRVTCRKVHEAQELFEHLCHYGEVPFWQIFPHGGHVDLRRDPGHLAQLADMRWHLVWQCGLGTLLAASAHKLCKHSGPRSSA